MTTRLSLFVRFLQLNPWIDSDSPWLARVLEAYESFDSDIYEDDEVFWL